MSNTLLTDLIRDQQAARATPCVLVANPEAVTEQLFAGDLENASNKAAGFLQRALAPDQTVFFYLGPSDVRYFVWVLAAMKTEKCVMFPSPGNTVPANQQLLKTVGAQTLLYAPEAKESLASLRDVTREEVSWVATPSYAELLSKEPAPTVYALRKTFEELRDVRVVGLHTSGTSGHPKPIYWTHGSISALASHSNTSGVYSDQFRSEGTVDLLQDLCAPGEVVMMPFPLYHMGGLSPLFHCLLYGNTHVMPATGTQMTSENITGILIASKATTAWLAPSLLENMLEYPPGLATLASMKHVVYGGGPMNPVKGEKLSKLVRHLCTIIGSTEGGACHLVSPPDSSHWNEFNFVDVGHRMEPGEGGLFELVYPNTELTQRGQLYFHSFPQLAEYRTRDLFSPVPGKEGWWTYRGRTDNWITMSNALKMDPTDIENTIGAHPDVRGVLVAGDRRYRLCMLVELKDDAIPDNDTQRAQALNSIWPLVEASNKNSSKFGRIPRELVYLTTREKPFLRASKGTIQRRLTIDAFAEEINELYARAEQGLLTDALPQLQALDQASLTGLLQHLYADVLELDDGIAPEDNLIAAGIDSFGTMTILSRLKAALRQHGVPESSLQGLNIRMLYSASTVASLAKALVVALHTSEEDVKIKNGLEGKQTKTDVLALIQNYRAQAQQLVENAPVADKQSARQDQGQTVLLTGSTGSLGSYLLDALLARPDVRKVICLNRGSDGRQRQEKSHASRLLSPLPAGQDRVVFFEADLGSERLGLSQEVYALVARETTTIVHNAYPVNFLMNVWQFEPHLMGLVNLLKLSLHRDMSLHFVSSISTAMSATGKRQQVPEIVLDVATQIDDLLPQGYAQSKYVCENMLEAFADALAARSAPAQPVTVLRVGQICGPRLSNGPWNEWEWFPSLVSSSRFLGVAPNDIGPPINWIPVDELAKIVIDLMDPARATVKAESSPLRVFNVVNPKQATWKDVLPALQATIPEIIPVAQWLVRLEESTETSTHLLDRNPGTKLVSFYQGALVGGDGAGPIYEVDRLVQASSTAANLGPVTQSDLTRWMDAWA